MQRRWLAILLIIICGALVVHWSRSSNGDETPPTYEEKERAAMVEVTICDSAELAAEAGLDALPDALLQMPGFQTACKRREACLILRENELSWCDDRYAEQLIEACDGGGGAGEQARNDLCAYSAGLMLQLTSDPFMQMPSGEISDVSVAQSSDGSGAEDVRVCATIENGSTTPQSYTLALHHADGALIDRAPNGEPQSVTPGERAELCVGSSDSVIWNLDDLSDTVQLTLMADTHPTYYAHPDPVVVDVTDVALR